MDIALRFVLGLLFGSFLNVIALRYDPDRFIFARLVLGGRSHCPHCRKTLRWHELFPLLSFVLQRGRCRGCHKPISWQYPLVELICGALFVLAGTVLPFQLVSSYALTTAHYALFAAFFSILLLMSLIDVRLRIIPDELNLLIVFLGVGRLLLEAPHLVAFEGTFVPSYALLFGAGGNIWLNHLLGALVGFGMFFFLVLLTRGRGMGMGDVKLALALGVFLGWPDVLLSAVFAFIIGSAYGLIAILLGRERMKSAVPFGPFLALGAVVLILFGNDILSWYFSLFGM